MENTIVEKYFTLNLVKTMMKTSITDNNMFDIMYQALLEKQDNITDIIGTTSNISSVKEDSIFSVSGYKNVILHNLPINYKSNLSQIDTNETSTYNTNYQEKTSNLSIDEILNNLDNIKNTYTPARGEKLELINNAVSKYSEKYNVDKNLVLAIIKQESNFDPDVVSYAGAMGLMQLMDFNCKTYGITEPLDIEQNIEGGVRHIKTYLDMYNGDIEMALMAYNGGPGNMQRRGVYSINDIYKMPSETQNYVPKVMNYYKNGFSI